MYEYSILFFEPDTDHYTSRAEVKDLHFGICIFRGGETIRSWAGKGMAKLARVEIVGKFNSFHDSDYKRIHRRASRRADQYNRRHGISAYAGNDVYPEELRDGKFAWDGWTREVGKSEWEHGHY